MKFCCKPLAAIAIAFATSFLLALVPAVAQSGKEGSIQKAHANEKRLSKQGASSTSVQPLMQESDLAAKEQQMHVTPKQAAPGTYQIIYNDEQSATPLPIEILVEVEKQRQPDKETFIQIGNTAQVRILPFSVINSKDFTPLEEWIISK